MKEIVVYDPYAEFKEYRLPNGLTLYHTFWNRPWIAAEFIVYAGAKDDPPGKEGVSHFLEHMVSENAESANYDEMKKFFEGTGGHVSFGRTSFIATNYDFFIPNKDYVMARAFNLFKEMLLRNKLEKFLERERSIILREWQSKYHFYEEYQWDLEVAQALFPSHPFGRFTSVLGSPESIKEISETEIINYYGKYYTPANISMVIGGGVQIDRLMQILEETGWTTVLVDGVRNPKQTPLAEAPQPLSRGKHIKLGEHTSMKTDATRYSQAWSLPGTFNPGQLNLYRQILRDLLISEIRTKSGLTYNVSVGWRSAEDLYEFFIASNITPGKVGEVDEIVERCIKDLPKDLTNFEYNKNLILEGFKLIDHSGMGMVRHVTSNLISERVIVTVQFMLDKYGVITIDDMQRLSDLLSFDRSYSLIINP